MNKSLVVILSFLLFAVEMNCANSQKKISVGSEKTLIVYLSRTNNTKVVAELIQHKVGGELIVLIKENPYPEDYQKIVDQVDRENEEGYLPPLKTEIEDLESYDTIFIGFPTWDMQMPPPMKSFLTQNDMSRKTIIPFNTNAGFGVGRGFEQLRELCPESDILEGFSVEGGYEKRGVFLAIKGEREEEVSDQLDTWLQKIGLL
ncbi:flavodoxin family protein [Salegentibacter flavus]|uniref:Flavodoxin n=1 Tax=Salegentibacter flavus TaxID=287099 RepID=A0A1I4XYY4_9FLAO|nr:flavodoxin [Salegentibacter flavus]SFN30449.1 Flavodoxin [Salegentibacter flavus]